MAFPEEQDETATQTQTQISIHQSRFEKMVYPLETKPALRLANFLNPLSNNPHKAKTFLPNTPFLSEIFPHDLRQWPSKVIFRGWYGPLRKWKQWVDQLSPKFSPIWKQAGIHQAIMASVYDLSPNPDTVLGLSEFWCSETNTFIFPWGEATITLEDVYILGGYPVIGDPVTGGSPVLNHEMGTLEEKFKNYRLKNLKKKGIQATHHGWLNYFMEEKRESRDDVVHIAFLSVWLSRFVFPSIAAKHILISLIPTAVKLSHGVKLALGPAVLASLYRNLTIISEQALASRDKINVSGPFQLLQIWVCERFPVIGPKPADLLLPGLPRMARWNKLNLKLTLPLVRLAVKEAKSFCWRPYAAKLKNWCYMSCCKEKEQLFSDCSGLEDDLRSFHRFLLVSYVVGMDSKEKYFPHRVAMQFGLDQDIPSHLLSVSLGSREPGQLFVPSRSFQPCVTLRYSDWWKGLILSRQEKSKNTKNGHLVSSSMQASGNSQDDHGKGAAAKPFDSDSESSMESRSQNHPFKVYPEVPCEDKTRANNDHVVREEWNEADAGRFQDFPSTPTILKGSSSTISPLPGFHGLSSNAKKRIVHEFIDNEGDGPASLPCDKKTKVAETGKEPPVPIQAGICKAGISNVNLVKVEYTNDGDGDDDVVIISHLDMESNKCSSRKEKLSGRESFKVSETPNNFKISSEVNAEEKTEPVKRRAKYACDFVTEAGGFHRKVKVEPGNSANEPFGNTKVGKDSSKEHRASVWGMAGECASNPINLDEYTTSSDSVNTQEDVEKRLQKLEKMLGLV